MTTFNDFKDNDTEGSNVNIVDSATPTNKASVDSSGNLRTKVAGDSDGTLIGNVGDKLKSAIHNSNGTAITDREPLQVSSNYEKIIEVILKSKWMKLAVYDEVITTVSGDRTEINVSFKEDSNLIGEAIINFVSDFSWDFVLYRYIVEDDGSKLLDDDDTPLLLE